MFVCTVTLSFQKFLPLSHSPKKNLGILPPCTKTRAGSKVGIGAGVTGGEIARNRFGILVGDDVVGASV
jgi:hypothetical protein